MAKFTYVLSNQKTDTVLDTGSFDSVQPYRDIAKILNAVDISRGSVNAVFTDENGNRAGYIVVKKNPKFIKSEYNYFPKKYLDAMDYPEPRYLTCVDPEHNSYKFYQIETKNGRTHVQYGRIGDDHGQFGVREYEYDLDMYWVKYYEKLSKGYIDQSEIKDFGRMDETEAIKNEGVEMATIKSLQVKDIVDRLIRSARDYVHKNYSYVSGKENRGFSMEAVNKVSALLDEMQTLIDEDGTVKTENIEPYKQKYYAVISVLPRYIDNVKNEAMHAVRYPQATINKEKDLLDALKTVIEQDELTAKNKDSKATVLDKTGLKIEPATFDEKLEIQKKMGEKIGCFARALKVNNEKTEKAYKKCLKEKGIRKEGCKLLFHGSRTENWWSIIKNGMSLNPNAVVTGKMFGQGLYFAPKAAKSMGYTDQQGSYWAHGRNTNGYLALFEVAMGKEYHPHKVLGSSFRGSDLSYGCHSVYAKGGSVGLRNDEAIIYDERQCTIRYLIETGRERTLDYKMNIQNIDAKTFALGEPFKPADNEIIVPFVRISKAGKEELANAGINAKKPVLVMNAKGDDVFIRDMSTKSQKEYFLSDGDKELFLDRAKDRLCESIKAKHDDEGFDRFMKGLDKKWFLPKEPDKPVVFKKDLEDKTLDETINTHDAERDAVKDVVKDASDMER